MAAASPPRVPPEVAEVMAALRRNPAFWQLKQEVKDSLVGSDTACKESPSPKALETMIGQYLAPKGGNRRPGALIDNEVLRRHWGGDAGRTATMALPPSISRTLGHAATAPPTAREPIDFLRRQQAEWRTKLVKRINRICKAKPGLFMASVRSPELRSLKWEALLEHVTEMPLNLSMYLYDPVDLLREAVLAEDQNFAPGGFRSTAGDGTKDARQQTSRPWGLIKVQFHMPTVAQLRRTLAALGLDKHQVGVDDSHEFADHRDAQGTAVIARGLVQEGRQYLQQGSPTHIRPAMWELALETNSGANHCGAAYIDQLRQHIARYDLFVDRLIAADVRRLANADDSFFVFEDIIKEVLLLLSRDERVPGAKACPMEPCVGTCRSGAGVRRYPPSGVLPFRGMAYFVAPLCYLYGDVNRAYRVAFALYTRYFCLLHSIGSASDGLLHLGYVFERLLQTQDPALFGHLVLIGLDPLTIALPWMMVAFSGVLPPDQTLLLWDRVVGFDCLLVLPILAVAIFRFRRNQLLAVDAVKQAEKLLADCVALNSTALLQFALFGDSLARGIAKSTSIAK